MALRFTRVATSPGNGVALGAPNQDVVVHKLLIGAPVDAGTVTLYNSSVSVSAATDNVAFKLTQPTAAAGKDWAREVDFGPGLALDGGSVQMTEDMDVCVVWDLKN